MNKKKLITLAATAGPAVAKVVRDYGPQLMRYLESHPDMLNQVQRAVGRVASTKGSSEETLHARIAALREQVRYLIASSDSPGEAATAKDFSRRLDGIEASVRMLPVMTPKQRRKSQRRIADVLDQQAALIVERFIDESIDDAR